MTFVITVLNLFEDIIKVQKRIIFCLKKEIIKKFEKILLQKYLKN